MVLMRSAWVLAMLAVTVLDFCRMGRSGGRCGGVALAWVLWKKLMGAAPDEFVVASGSVEIHGSLRSL